jgi:Protein  of unknown function (DUF3018)
MGAKKLRKQTRERVQRLRDRKREAGLVLVQLWLTQEQARKVRAEYGSQ